jgi:large subunit ribosomal protein L15
MKLNQLSDNPGAHQAGTRKGRGIGSTKGKTSGRGVKGQGARKSGNVRPGFEGGQNPLYRRLPMRGFNNSNFRVEYTVVNVGTLQEMAADGRLDAAKPITIDTIIAAGLTKKPQAGLKILGDGEIKVKLSITAAHASQSAVEKIAKAGGTLTLLPKKEKQVGKLQPKGDKAKKAAK